MTFTSKANGDWTNPLTWNEGGVPGIRDSVVISHAVTVSHPTGIGLGIGYAVSVLSGGSLDLFSVLTVYGDILGDDLITLEAVGNLILSTGLFPWMLNTNAAMVQPSAYQTSLIQPSLYAAAMIQPSVYDATEVQ